MSNFFASRRGMVTIVLLGAILVSLTIMTLIYKAQAEKLISYSTFNPKENGAKALFLTVKRLGYNARRWRRPLDELPKRGTIIYIEPTVRIDEPTWKKLIDFMNGGGRVFWVADKDIKYRGEKLLRFVDSNNEMNAVMQPTAYALPLKDFRFQSFNRLDSKSEAAVYHVGDKDGALLLTLRFGRGELVALADPDLITNEYLDDNPENLRLIMTVLGTVDKNSPVYFDESRHNLIEQELPEGALADLPIRVWSTLPLWSKLIMVQLTAIFLIWLYADGKRLGPPLVHRETGGEDTADYVDAMAILYRGAGARRLALGVIYRNFIGEITGKPGTGDKSETAAVIRAARRRNLDVDDVETLVERCRSLIERGIDLSERDLVVLSKELYSLKKELKPHA